MYGRQRIVFGTRAGVEGKPPVEGGEWRAEEAVGGTGTREQKSQGTTGAGAKKLAKFIQAPVERYCQTAPRTAWQRAENRRTTRPSQT